MSEEVLKDYDLTLADALALMEEGDEAELVRAPGSMRQRESTGNRHQSEWVGQVSEREVPIPQAS